MGDSAQFMSSAPINFPLTSKSLVAISAGETNKKLVGLEGSIRSLTVKEGNASRIYRDENGVDNEQIFWCGCSHAFGGEITRIF